MRKTTTPTLRLLRVALLVGLVAFVALVVALYRFGRSGLPTRSAPRGGGGSGEEVAVMSGQGFDYLITEGEQPLGRIRAERVVSQQEDEITLEKLDPVEVYGDDGDLYRLFSDRGTYNLHTRATTLRGNVRVEGPRGLELLARGLTMNRRERVTSDSQVQFRMAGEFAGRARHLIANFNQEVYTLSGRVEIDGISPVREPIRLRAARLVYEREALVVRATGNVRFDQMGSHLSAPTMLFHLTDDERTVRFVSAHDGVEGLLVERVGAAIERHLEVTGDELSVVFDPVSGEPIEAEVRAAGDRRARMASIDETSHVRSLVAPVLHARFVDGELSYAEAYGTVHLREYLAFDPSHILNWGCGERAEVTFAADGSIREAAFYERVEFRNRQALARGDRLDMTGEPYEITMVGEPARIVGVQGGLDAPRIVQQGEGGPVRAVGGVRGLFEQGQGEAALSLGGGAGPVRLESKEALWDREGQSFTFLEDVRLWQGENLLLAEEVESRTDTEVVVARGGIKTVMVPAKEAAESPPAAPEQSAESAESESSLAREPVEVTSEWMEYGIETRRILYHEGVRITQVGRVMQCDEAEAQLREAGGMEWLECRGGAQVKDNVAGRTVRGETAFFEVGRSEITFTGRPVVMTGEKGERIEGATLIYDLASGGARIAGPRPPGQDPRGGA